jgi:anti-sigma regulatory factor (Ser/Thr protein kinase)
MSSETPRTARTETRLPARAASVPVARTTIAPLAKACGADEAAVALCVTEAVTNVVQHAYRDGSDGDIQLRACVDGTRSDRALHVAVQDDGIGMSPRINSPGLGLGLSIIKKMAKAVEVRDLRPGCAIHMTFDCRPV